MKITRNVILLQYKKAGEPGPYGPVHYADSEKFVALDSASGGYPYSTNIDGAHEFQSLDAAKYYSNNFKELDLREVTITYEYKD